MTEQLSFLPDAPKPPTKPEPPPRSLTAWYAQAPECVRDWPIAEYHAIMAVAGSPYWPNSMTVLTKWLLDGYRPDSIAEVIAQHSRKVYSLSWYDKLVRARALRWDPYRAEYRAGYQ